jgi:hypothetical protein
VRRSARSRRSPVSGEDDVFRLSIPLRRSGRILRSSRSRDPSATARRTSSRDGLSATLRELVRRLIGYAVPSPKTTGACSPPSPTSRAERLCPASARHRHRPRRLPPSGRTVALQSRLTEDELWQLAVVDSAHQALVAHVEGDRDPVAIARLVRNGLARIDLGPLAAAAELLGQSASCFARSRLLRTRRRRSSSSPISWPSWAGWRISVFSLIR